MYIYTCINEFQSTSFSLPSLLIGTEDCTEAVPTVNLFLCRNVYDLGSQMYSNCFILQPICNILSCSHVYLANRNFFFLWKRSQKGLILVTSDQNLKKHTAQSPDIVDCFRSTEISREVLFTYITSVISSLEFQFFLLCKGQKYKKDLKWDFKVDEIKVQEGMWYLITFNIGGQFDEGFLFVLF